MKNEAAKACLFLAASPLPAPFFVSRTFVLRGNFLAPRPSNSREKERGSGVGGEPADFLTLVAALRRAEFWAKKGASAFYGQVARWRAFSGHFCRQSFRFEKNTK